MKQNTPQNNFPSDPIAILVDIYKTNEIASRTFPGFPGKCEQQDKMKIHGKQENVWKAGGILEETN